MRSKSWSNKNSVIFNQSQNKRSLLRKDEESSVVPPLFTPQSAYTQLLPLTGNPVPSYSIFRKDCSRATFRSVRLRSLPAIDFSLLQRAPRTMPSPSFRPKERTPPCLSICLCHAFRVIYSHYSHFRRRSSTPAGDTSPPNPAYSNSICGKERPPVFKKRKFSPFFKKCRDSLAVIVLPLSLFQLIRTIFLPTTFDVLLSALLFFTYVCFLKKWF